PSRDVPGVAPTLRYRSSRRDPDSRRVWATFIVVLDFNRIGIICFVDLCEAAITVKLPSDDYRVGSGQVGSLSRRRMCTRTAVPAPQFLYVSLGIRAIILHARDRENCR